MRALVDLNVLWRTLQALAIRKDQKVTKRNLIIYLSLFFS